MFHSFSREIQRDFLNFLFPGHCPGALLGWDRVCPFLPPEIRKSISGSANIVAPTFFAVFFRNFSKTKKLLEWGVRKGGDGFQHSHFSTVAHNNCTPKYRRSFISSFSLPFLAISCVQLRDKEFGKGGEIFFLLQSCRYFSSAVVCSKNGFQWRFPSESDPNFGFPGGWEMLTNNLFSVLAA